MGLIRWIFGLPKKPPRRHRKREKIEPLIERPEVTFDREFKERMRARYIASAKADRDAAIEAGSTSYFWCSVGEKPVCEACRRNDQKMFSWKKPPKETGHPGMHLCPSGWCRCYARPIYPS